MARRRKAATAALLNAEEVAAVAKANPFIQRLIDDADLRANLHRSVDSTKRVYERLSASKNPAKALLDDKKLQAELRKALEHLSEATSALAETPAQARRKSGRVARKLLLVGAAGGAALAASPPLRSKVLDVLFGAEEEFQYSAPTAPEAPADSPPVSAV
jgi:hypothetical protein